MRVSMQKGADSVDLDLPRWSVAVTGEVLDDRGDAAVRCVSRNASNVITLSYDPDRLEIVIDGEEGNVDSLTTGLQNVINGDVVLESTTLGFAEILLCCRAFRRLGVKSLDILYVEPQSYRNPKRKQLLHKRDFELSDAVPGYSAIPGFGILLGDRTPQKGVFFLGYEDARLRRAFEDMQMLQSSRATVAIGVPAFQPGWEMDSIANNIGVIREQNILGGVHFCGAANPVGAMDILSQVKDSLEAGERMFAAPIGTKPHGIGVALFASTHGNVGVIYDHPRRTIGRSGATANWHLFSVVDYPT